MTGGVSGAALTLVREGVDQAVIAWWSDARSPVPAFAVRELRDYVERMSGARLRTVQVSAGDAGAAAGPAGIVLAAGGARTRVEGTAERPTAVPSTWLERAGRTLAEPAADAHALTTVAADAMVLCAADPRGLLYAVYDVLERLGARFFAPRYAFYEGHAERVPHRDTVTLPWLDVRQAPSFAYRRKYVEEGWSHTPDNLRQLVDWMAKNRLNVLVCPYDYLGAGVVRWDDMRDSVLSDIADRGILVEVGGHGYESFLPGSDYPHHYTAGTGVFDVHDDDAVRAYTDNVVEYLRRRPEIGVFDAWPPDDAPWPDEAVDRYGSVANAHVHVTNALRQAVEAAVLDVTIEAIAYLRHLEPPADGAGLDRTVLVDIAPYDRSYARPVFDEHTPANARYVELIRQWRGGHAGQVALYEYYRKYSWHSLPTCVVQLIGREIPFYHSLGLTGIGTYSEPADWITYEVVHLLLARLSWDVTVAPDTWLRRYLEDRYGDASRAVGSYLEHVEAATRSLFDRPAGNYGSLGAVSAAREHYLSAREALESAVTSGGPAGFMAGRLADNLEFAVADTEIAYYRLRGDLVLQRSAMARARRLVEANSGRGTVLRNRWTIQRYQPETGRDVRTR